MILSRTLIFNFIWWYLYSYSVHTDTCDKTITCDVTGDIIVGCQNINAAGFRELTDSPSHDWVNDSLSIYKAVPLALDLIKLFLKQFKDALEWRKINLRTTEPNSIVKELKKEPKRDKIAEGDSNYQFQRLWKKFQNELIDLRLQRSPNRSQEIIISTGSKIQNVQFTKISQNIFNIL